MTGKQEICKCGHQKAEHEFLEGLNARHHCNILGCSCVDYEEGNIYCEIMGHVNRANELLKQSDDLSPQLANLALKGAVCELVWALGKLCKEMVVATA